MEKTIKYLENGEYHYATVRSVGDLAQLQTDSKETLVEAINELWNGGGNVDPSKVPKPEGYDQLVQDVADAVKNQQEISQQWVEWQNEEAQLTEERKQAYLKAMKKMQESIDKAKADAEALNDKTAKLDEQITKTFSELNTNIQNMHEQLQKEADRMNQDLQDTKGTLSTLRTDLQNTQMDNGRIHDELTNINGKFEHKVWQTDLDPLKEQIDRAETSVQQTKDELLGKASRQDLDTVTNTVSKLDTQLKETAKGVEISVKKDELGGEIAEALTNKTNILLGTRRFTTNNWTQRDHVEICSDPWKGFLVAKQNSPIEGIQQAYEAKTGTTYTFSLFAKMDNLDDSNKPQIILAKNNLDTSLDTKIDVWRKEIEDITSDFKRYDLTFTPSEDCTIYPHVISNSNNPIFVCGYQLEIGKELTPWEPNQEDVGDYVEKSEAQFNVYNDKIQALTEKQRQQGDTQEKLRTEVTQTAEGVKQVSESLKNTNGDITKLRGDLERTADHMKSEYETYTNKAVGQISDSTLNLIRNSSFQNKDEDFAQWQNVSAKANVRQDENGLRWVELTQSGLTTDNPQGLTSNYFNVKQGKVTVAVDIKSGDKATLDNESVLFLELYNDAKKRVDFKFVTLSELGLNKTLLDDHKVHRGLYRLGIDRNDAKYMTVKAHLMRNGDLYFTNFSARLSSIDDGAYEPNPDDLNQQILKQNTKIEQNSKEVAIKANSVDVTRDIKSAVDNVQVGGVNLVENGDANASNTTPWPNTLCQNHDFYFNGTKKMFNLHTASKNELVADNVKWIPIEAGQQYTLSFKGFMSWNVSSYDVWLLGRKVGINGAWTNSFPIISGQRLSNSHCETITKTFTAPSDWNNFEAYLRFDNNGSSDGNDSVFFFNEVKLEKGNKATSYSPAPGDISAEIKSAKDAAIQVASGQINLRVNELSTQFDDKLNKRINEQKTASEKFTSDGIEQVVTKITNVKGDVDRLGDTVKSTGSRNLLHNTSDRYKTLTGNGYLTQSTASDIYTSTANYHGGDWFTYAATITNNSSKNVTLETWLFDQNKQGLDANSIAPIQLATHSTDVYPSEKDKRVSTSFQISGTTWFIRTYVIFDGGGAPNGSQVQVKDERLVEGKLDGSWSPNPDDINKKIDTQTLDSANIDDLRIQGHYFVRNLTGNPIGGWVYVDVTGNNNDRIRQDVYQDNGGKHMSRRLFGNSWSGWEQGAYLSDVNNVKTEVTASVKNLGDRVITQVNSITSKVDNMKIGGRNLLKGTRDFNSKYWYQSGDHTALADNPIDTSTKEIHSWLDWHSFKNKQTIQLDPSKNYMISADIAIYDGDGNGLYVAPYGTVDGQGSNLAGTDVNLAGFPRQVKGEGFRRIYLPVTAHGRTLKDFRIEGHGNWSAGGGSVFISKIALYEGNTPLAWSDASDDFVEAIKEVNTKWDVANGQIQGKVTATDVNNILNGKGYATQSWAQTMFQMKSDSITLQAVRDNITNGIQNQVNSIQGKLEGDLSNICRNPTFSHGVEGWKSSHLVTEGPWSEMPTPKNGTLFVRDAYYGELFPVSKGERYYTSVFAHNGDSADFVLGLCFKLKDGTLSWISGSRVPGGQTGKYDGYIDVPDNAVSAQIWASIQKFDNFGWVRFTNVVVKKNDAISQINLSPDQIKIASNKIVIDGNTDIRGTLRVPEVRLQGKSGMIGLDGNKGIIISSADTLFQTRVTKFGMDLLTTTNGQKEIMGGITTGFSTNNGNLNGISIVLDTQQKLGYPYGGDFFSIGNTTSIVNDDNRSWNRAMDYDASGQLHQGGFMWYEKSYLTGEGQNIYVGGVRGNGNSAYDPLMIGTTKFSASAQPDKYQPVISLGYAGGNVSKAGIGFLWDQMKPYGSWDISDVGDIWFNGIKFRFAWVHHGAMFNNQQQPAFYRVGDDGSVTSGIAFALGSTWDVGSGAWNITQAMINLKNRGML